MRCVICDYCPDVADKHKPHRDMIYLRKENGYVCSDCSDSIGGAIADFRPEVDEAELEAAQLLEERTVEDDTGSYRS